MKIEKRIEALERRLPKLPTKLEKWFRWQHCFQTSLIAHYLGQPGEYDSVMTAYARGLGFVGIEGWHEFDRIRRSNFPEIDRKHIAAWERLLQKFEVRAERDGMWEDLDKLVDGLSPFFKRTLQESRDRIWKDRYAW